ncbi:hypothetical protein MHU86_22699 [Fragilaria crotonensis]|nr:hypothetical protein MHU86_22699 [Fragilaria crotonensis]
MIESNGSFHDVANNNMRKIIARRLTESKSQVPHFYTSMEIELDNIISLRKNLANNHGVKVSVNDLIIRSSALALRDVPELMQHMIPRQIKFRFNHLSISLSLSQLNRAHHPIVPSTDRLGLAEISDKAAILAVGEGTARVVPTPWVDGAEKQQSPQIRTIMTARLSADRRVVDEATASLFLSALRHYLSKPELLML